MSTIIRRILILLPFTLLLFASCKKNKSDSPQPSDGTTTLQTLEIKTAQPSQQVYGLDFTFRLQFDQLKPNDVTEYGIVYISHITASGETKCELGSATAERVKFGTSPKEKGKPESVTKTLSFSAFNDVNYRAYAILADGTVLYGEVKYIGFA